MFTSCLVALELAVGSSASEGVAAPSAATGVRDFSAYWAAARLLLLGRNPYSPAEVFALQRSVGMSESSPLIMWNPPWALAFLWPFGLVDFNTGQFLWLSINVLLILISAQQLMKLYGGRENRTGAGWLLVFSFVPTIYALLLGQMAPVILFAVTMFLLAERNGNWLALGLVLVLMSIKPHFLYLFWLAFALWLWREREWRVILSPVVIGCAVGTLPLIFDSRIYANYVSVYQSSEYPRPFDLPSPSLRNAAKILFEIESAWIGYMFTAAGAIWLLLYWRRNQREWVWSERLPLILLVSVVTSPYSWTYDHVVFLPAIIQTYSWVRHRLAGFMVAYLLFNAAYLVLRYHMPLDVWYFWMAPLLLAVYLWFERLRNNAPAPAAC